MFTVLTDKRNIDQKSPLSLTQKERSFLQIISLYDILKLWYKYLHSFSFAMVNFKLNVYTLLTRNVEKR